MTQEPKKKIIIDEDWKTQVESEREQLKDQPSPSEATPDDAQQYEIPPASFPFLIQSIMTQALMAMGHIPDPIDNKPVVRLDLAKHHIDMLSVIDQKTRGNLDAEEAKMVEEVLHQLRIGFMGVQNLNANTSGE